MRKLKLTKRQAGIRQYLCKCGDTHAAKLGALFKISKRQVRREIADMVKQGVAVGSHPERGYFMIRSLGDLRDATERLRMESWSRTERRVRLIRYSPPAIVRRFRRAPGLQRRRY